ncbi:Hypothetical protein, putative [Bodo saltans]|uniref:CPC1/SPEF2 domain-containing protein n=1 Tax=Bodo saltans TaxID=75058 RepID=A0A0S4IM97_BODSA|nr:Hypothetical protein, putative [Bodo saltans]|eukprot:CUE73089.1 Hypothetical protein, putative [Bodo saltans]
MAQSEQDACASYVAMLQSRRSEEEASRNSRAQRRANTVAFNNEMYKRRAGAIRRRAMEEKLGMTSQKEQELFEELSALSKWRHVMYENIAHREEQHQDAAKNQVTLHRDHLANVQQHETAQFKETIRDDKERFDAVLQATVEAKKKDVLNCCRSVVNDVVLAVEEHIAFIGKHGLDGRNAVPKILSDALARNAAFPTNPDLVKASLVQNHVDLTLYTDKSTSATVTDRSQSNSKLFVSLVHKMLNLQYPKPPPFRPKRPTPFPIVAIVGPKFSGKTIISEAVAQSLGMVCLSDVTLIRDAISEFEELTPTDWSDATSAELLDLGRECQESLLNGKPISVELLSRLVLFRLKHLPEDCSGVILDGSPANVEGFESLEKVLSGYDKTRLASIPDELLAPLLDDISIDDMVFNVEKVEAPIVDAAGAPGAKKDAKAAKPKGKKDEHEEPLPPIDLPEVEPVPPLSEEEEEAIAACERDTDVSALHSVIHLDCPAEELFRRFAGLRVDVETGVVYHLTNNPPPPERLPFLVHKDRSEASTAKIHKMVEDHIEEWSECLEWLNRYDGLVHNMDSNKPVPELTTAVLDMANLAADNAGIFYQRYCLAEEVRQRQQELEVLFQERQANREAARKQLAAIYIERGADLPVELQEPLKSSEPVYLTLPPQVPPLFLEQLHHFNQFYGGCINDSHGILQGLMRTVFEYGNSCEAYVAAYWQQPDPKQGLLDAFLGEFNQMQPALRRDVQGKEELHLRAEQLTEQLFNAVEKRRDECNQLIEALHHRGALIDAWSDSVRATGITLIQAEVERFFLVRNLSLVYFSALRNDPCSIEDELLELVPQLKLVVQEAVVDPKAAKDKKAPPPKKGGKVADEAQDKIPEDIFTPAVDKALQIMKHTSERLSASQPQAAAGAKGGKDKKGAAEVVQPEAPTVHILAAPIVTEELEAAMHRIHTIVAFVKELIRIGSHRAESVKAKLLGELRRKQIVQASAVNSAVFEIRCAIEEERPVLYYLHIGCDTFNIETSRVLATIADAVAISGVPFAGLAAPPVQDVNLLTSLTRNRVLSLIKSFRLLAPQYNIHKEDFILIVHPSDYVDAIPKANARSLKALSPDALFDRFDINNCGAIDWRDFLVHLLFWCEPFSTESSLFESMEGSSQSLGIEGPSLMQLFDMHADIGNEPLAHEEFLDTPLFFDGEMAEDRLTAYLDVLWEIFREAGPDGILDVVYPDVLLTFLSPDPQPLRGVQKAFVVAALPGDETCSASLEALDRVFHLNAACPRNMFMYDPHDAALLQSLFPIGHDTLVFNDACKTHVGRVLFNGTRMFHRKLFV